MSSLLATRARLETLLPVYTASKVSKLLPFVVITAVWFTLGVHLYQIECPPISAAWLGSPASLVAQSVLSEVLNGVAVTLIAFAKLSLAGVHAGWGPIVIGTTVTLLFVSLLAIRPAGLSAIRKT